MKSLSIETSSLMDISGKLMDGHIKYGFGSKAKLNDEPQKITAIDCSGFVQYVIYQATKKQMVLPAGSWNQRVWCDNQKLSKVEYSSANEKDGWLRIAFIAPKSKTVPGHVWLILDGMTLESHGPTKGPNRRAWSEKILKSNVYACYKFAQTYTQYRYINIRNVA
jgi:hypothetical protein